MSKSPPLFSALPPRFAARPGLPIDVTHPDPHPGDPWPAHLFLHAVEWPAPLGAVLRPDTAPSAEARAEAARRAAARRLSAAHSAALAAHPPKSSRLWALVLGLAAANLIVLAAAFLNLHATTRP